MEKATDKIVWYFMVTAMGVLIVGGGAWANSINTKVERIAALEVNVQYITTDIKDIKCLIKDFLK